MLADRPDRYRPFQGHGGCSDPHGVGLHDVICEREDVDVLIGVDVGAVADIGRRRVIHETDIDAAGQCRKTGGGDRPANEKFVA